MPDSRPDSRPMSRRLPRPILSMRASDRKVSASVSVSGRAWLGALPGFTTVPSPRSQRGGSSRKLFPKSTRCAGTSQVNMTDCDEIIRPIRSDTCVACGGGLQWDGVSVRQRDPCPVIQPLLAVAAHRTRRSRVRATQRLDQCMLRYPACGRRSRPRRAEQAQAFGRVARKRLGRHRGHEQPVFTAIVRFKRCRRGQSIAFDAVRASLTA